MCFYLSPVCHFTVTQVLFVPADYKSAETDVINGSSAVQMYDIQPLDSIKPTLL